MSRRARHARKYEGGVDRRRRRRRSPVAENQKPLAQIELLDAHGKKIFGVPADHLGQRRGRWWFFWGADEMIDRRAREYHPQNRPNAIWKWDK